MSGKVADVARIDAPVVAREFARSDEMASEVDASGVVRPGEVSYAARIEFDSDQSAPLLRAAGTAEIAVDWTPLGSRLMNYLRRTFTF